MNELFGATGAALALMIAAVTQAVKEATGLEGRQAKLLSLAVGAALGILLGLFGLQGEAARLLPAAPLWLASGLIGLLLGVVAQGGYSMVTWLQDRGVAKRAELEQSLRASEPPAVIVAEPGALAAPAQAVPVIGLLSQVPEDDEPFEIDPMSEMGRAMTYARDVPDAGDL